jgi:hypothetical protein
MYEVKYGGEIEEYMGKDIHHKLEKEFSLVMENSGN